MDSSSIEAVRTRSERLLLPPTIRARDGALVDVTGDVWSIRDASTDIKINFGKFEGIGELIESIKKVLLWHIENQAVGTVSNVEFRVRQLLANESTWCGRPVREITASSILRFRETFKHPRDEFFTHITAFLRRWHAFGIPGLTDDAIQVLNKIRTKGRPRGQAVLTMDPDRGPLTALESDGLYTALSQAFARKTITLENFVLALLFSLLGQRPTQYAALKVCDVESAVEEEKGSRQYFLNVPRAKQKGRPLRTEFTRRRLYPEFGQKLVLHAEEVQQRFAHVLPDPSQAPLFPVERCSSKSAVSPTLRYHHTGTSLAVTCTRIYRKLRVVSERTGRPMHPTPIRFRRTVGTRAAEAGHPVLVIAKMLDHNTTKAVAKYVDATSLIRKRIDHALAMRLAPLVDAFQGSIVCGGTEDPQASEATNYIADPRFDPTMRPLGDCAHHAPCNLLAPIACYTCPSYRPWADGPHSEVLEHLIKERDHVFSNFSPQMASARDSTILAAARVVQLCEEFDINKHGPNHG